MELLLVENENDCNERSNSSSTVSNVDHTNIHNNDGNSNRSNRYHDHITIDITGQTRNIIPLICLSLTLIVSLHTLSHYTNRVINQLAENYCHSYHYNNSNKFENNKISQLDVQLHTQLQQQQTLHKIERLHINEDAIATVTTNDCVTTLC